MLKYSDNAVIIKLELEVIVKINEVLKADSTNVLLIHKIGVNVAKAVLKL